MDELDLMTEDHRELRAAVADFAAREVGPQAAGWDAEHRIPAAVLTALGDLGVFALGGPEEFGGIGDFTGLCIAIEELGRHDQSLGITVEAAVGLGVNPVATFGSREQQERWLPELMAGRALAAFGLTEAEAGSDAAATRTRAELVQGRWVLNGSKQFITNSGHELTRLVTVTARTGVRADGRPELSTILVPHDTPGLVVEPAYAKLGWHASDTHPLTLVDATVPEQNLLGERGRGFAQFLSVLDDGRVAIAALALGCLRACRDLAARYAAERTSFGAPIGSRQGIAFQVADLDAWCRAAHLLVYSAAAMKDAGTPPDRYARAAAVAKLQVTEWAVSATRVATQVFGGYGFMEEYPVARLYRDAKVLEIGEGTSEVQRMVLARGLGLLRR